MTVIKSLEIISFGKFRNFTLNLKPGLNELVHENEYGKSTITDFILFMLYGFTKTTSKKLPLEENLLKKYLPWQGEAILSGAMELTQNGKLIRIERMQNDGRKKLVVMRDSGGEELPISDSPGKMLFGVDRETFERTFLIRQTDIKFSGTGGLESALKNLVTTGDESTSYESAAEALRRKHSKYRHTGRQSGRIFDIQKELGELSVTISQLESELTSLSDAQNELFELEKAASSLDAEEKKYREMLPAAKGADARRKLQRLKELEMQIRNYAQKLSDYENTVQIDSQTAQEISKTFAMRELLTQQLKDAKQRLDKAETDARKLSEGFPEYDTISQNETKLRQLADRRPRVRAPLCAAGVLTVVMGISVMLYGLILPGALLAAAGAAAVICAVVFKAKVRIPAQLGMTQKELCAALEKYESAKDKAAQCRAEINNARNELESIQNQLGDCVEKCQDIKEKYKISDAESLHKRTKIQAESRARLQSIEALKAQRCELLTDKSKDELEKLALSGTIDSISEAQVNQALLKITEDKSRAIEKIKELSAKGKKYAELSLGLIETKQREKELNSELENALYNDRVLSTAREALDEAYRYISDMYSPILTECARQPLTEITDGRYDSVMLDRGFNLRVKSGGTMHELGYFSRGTADAVYFAMRTAVSDLISGRQNLPLIMDDPFWSLDDKRLENARRFTEKAAKNRQIIIFSARK